MSNYQDSISSANKAGAVIAGSAACWAKLTHGAAVPGNRRQAPGRSTAPRLPGGAEQSAEQRRKVCALVVEGPC